MNGAMDFYLTGRNVELTEALRDHVERHLRQAVQGLTTLKTMRMEVQLYRTSQREIRYGCHVSLQLSHRHVLNIREEDRDLYEAIDIAQKRLVHAITEYRDRRLTENRHARRYSHDRLVRALGLR
jgi:ribosomal subunit interface protein